MRPTLRQRLRYGVDDVIVSDKLISLILAQVSETPHLEDVFAELFRAEGSELYTRPATDYVAPGASVTFATVVEAARRRGEVAIGFRLADGAYDPARSYGVHVNPSKSTQLTAGERDRVVVLAED